jgi:uridine kinase
MEPEMNLTDPNAFSAALYEKMLRVDPGVACMELYEFRYALEYLLPPSGWDSVVVNPPDEVEEQVARRDFYTGVQLKPRAGGSIVLDETLARLSQMLFVGLVTGAYPREWLCSHFYFDVRGFFFLVRTHYFTPAVLEHLGGSPYRSFELKQTRFASFQDLGYQEFKAANAEVDRLFIESVQKLIARQGTPILIAIAGPTAAGKTEIVERLRGALDQAGKSVASIELDNFLTDRDQREEMGIRSEGKAAIHFDLFMHSLAEIQNGRRIRIPRYNFIDATSSHDLQSRLKPGRLPIEIEPADVVFIEGNFPFLLPEVARLIGIKVVYLTDDPLRLKRKWKRDIDYRKKYDPYYFRNRFFKDQFLAAQICYIPQMCVCDLLVDTTGAALWATPQVTAQLDGPALML